MALDVAISRSPSSIVVNTTHIATGASLGSSNPSMASVNADYTHFNQVVALYNRRTHQAMSTPATATYFSSGSITASGITSLRTKINTLRALFGLAAQTYTNTTISAGDHIKKVDLDELFAALNFSSVTSISGGTVHKNQSTESPYGTKSAADVNTTGSGTNLGTSVDSGGTFTRLRLGVAFAIPSFTGLATPVNASVALALSNWVNTLDTILGFRPQYKISLTDDSAFASGWQNNGSTTGGGGGFGTYNVNSQNLTVFASLIPPLAGSHMSMVIGSDQEFAGTDRTTHSTASKFDCSSTIALNYDWGF